MRLRAGPYTLDISFPLTAVMTAVILLDRSLSAAACFSAVLLHESGHLLVLRLQGTPARHFRLTLFDVAILDKRKPLRSLPAEAAVIYAGIAANAAGAALSLAAERAGGGEFFTLWAAANLSLAVFNGLPVESLDGGQGLALLLSHWLGPAKAFRLMGPISFCVLLPTATVGFYLLLQTKYNFSLLLTAVYLMALLVLRRKHEINLQE